jgi:hypothetical protein
MKLQLKLPKADLTEHATDEAREGKISWHSMHTIDDIV